MGELKTDDETCTGLIHYDYDKNNRLVKEMEKRDGTTDIITYTYDAVGNRIKKLENGVLTKYTYNELNQIIEESCQGETISYAYDVNGNLICKGTEETYDSYSYTKKNQLEAVLHHTPGGETKESYTYDAEGNRLSKTVGDVNHNS